MDTSISYQLEESINTSWLNNYGHKTTVAIKINTSVQ